MCHVFFPTAGIVSLLYVLHDGGSAESALTGITVLDRTGLEQRVCECYAVVRREADRLESRKPEPFDPCQPGGRPGTAAARPQAD